MLEGLSTSNVSVPEGIALYPSVFVLKSFLIFSSPGGR